jgi:hypothetical protein
MVGRRKVIALAALLARNIAAALPNCLILIWSFFIGCPTAVTADDVGAAGDEAVRARARVRYRVAVK